MPKVSMRQYAKHRCVSHTAVQKAVKTGKLSRAVVHTPNGIQIDSKVADREWKPSQNYTKSAEKCPECGRPWFK